jgi:hypothetical protein
LNTMTGTFGTSGAVISITNTSVTTSSKVLVQLQTTDTNLKSLSALPQSGFFTVTGNTTAAAACVASFVVIN